MYILGISSFYHDSGAALIKNGKILSAVQEERFTRIKHDNSFPYSSIDYCLNENNLKIEDIGEIVFYENPKLKMDRILKTFISNAPTNFRLFSKAFISQREKWKQLKKEFPNIKYIKHHESHAASAFYPSPFKEAVIVTLDGVGEWDTASVSVGIDNKLKMIQTIEFPNSLGFLYSAFTYYCGFRVNSGEYKLMGLAPYGKPIYYDEILENLIDVREDGSFSLNLDYFGFCNSDYMINDNFCKLFDGDSRESESKITQKECDLAASIQKVTEDIVFKICKNAKEITGQKNLCLAGGVALNCVSNGKLQRSGLFDNIWIQPAAGDAGGALGAALYINHNKLNGKRIVKKNDSMNGSLLGPKFTNKEVKKFLDDKKINYKYYSNKDLFDVTANHINDGNVIGWFQDRMEFGPRALGSRSIVGDARSSKMQSIMNLKIKFRESFRPFAPIVLDEDKDKYFDLDVSSPYMLLVSDVNKSITKKVKRNSKKLDVIKKVNEERSSIPAITHVDYSARVQTVDKRHKSFYELLKSFKKLTGCSVLVNTSFNVRGEPIVHTPKDAYNCFMLTDMDYLVLGNYVLDKKSQSEWSDELKTDYLNKFELD
tara:strand:+ start:511 stop:2307 length:1797 start_codon:yes stop_codon:yes gene_type:complete